MTSSLMLCLTWTLGRAFFCYFFWRFCPENFKKYCKTLTSSKPAIKSLSLNHVNEMTSGFQPLWLGLVWLTLWLYISLFIIQVKFFFMWWFVCLVWPDYQSYMSSMKVGVPSLKTSHNLKAYLQATR